MPCFLVVVLFFPLIRTGSLRPPGALGFEWGGTSREQLSRLKAEPRRPASRGGPKGRPPPWTPPGHQSSPLFIRPGRCPV